MKTVLLLVVGLLFGLGAGWWLRPVVSGRGDGDGDGGAVPGPGHDHRPALPEFSPATLENLGVTVAKIAKRDFSRYVPVAGVVVPTPWTEQPVFAPIGGRVQSIEVELGQVVEAGEILLTLLRDPLPRPTLTLTADILRPGQERLHGALLDLRKAAEEVRITETELARVEKFTGTVGGREIPLLPRSRAIGLEYELARARRAFEEARHELEKHGFSAAQIEAARTGEVVASAEEKDWKLALQRNGLWPAAAERLHGALPAPIRELPWVTATVGELAASGLATAELAAWVEAEAGVAEHFLEVGVLLQHGHTLADLKRLYSLDAFEPVVRVRAPVPHRPGGAWDLREILVKPGATVVAGTPLLGLSDPSELYLRAEPVGGEVSALLAAASSGAAVLASPLVDGTGPELEDLKVGFVRSSAGAGAGAGTGAGANSTALLPVRNSVLLESPPGAAGQERPAPRRRTWALRQGQRYVLRVPTGKIEAAWVLPAAAVTRIGHDEVVFLEDGRSFKPVPVSIAYRDHAVVVVPASKSVQLFEGDRVAQSGAFELGLAQKGGDGGSDAHHGHSH